MGLLCLVGAIPAWADDPPNFVVILCDDLGIGDIGPYGNERIKTPNLDRMAAEGALLTDFYAAANVCTASRAGILTGRYPARMGLAKPDVARATNDMGLNADEITIAAALKPAGYATACIGKWHLGHADEQWPTAHGFDYFYGLRYSNDMLPLALYRMSEPFEEPVDQTTLTKRYTEEAIGFIEAHRDEPFFVYLPHSMPHVPLFASEKFEGVSDVSLYGDVIEELDWSVGEILATLERLGLDENTLVLFTSDNGPWWEGSSGPYRNRKGSSWDGGMRVPLIARWPGTIPAGTRSNAIGMNIDLLPTLVQLAGLELPDDRPIDGRDLMPVLTEGADSGHSHLLLFDGSDIACVRTQDWKLVARTWYRGHNAHIGNERYYYHPGLLFNMRDHPEELYSVAREHPEIAARLDAYLAAGREELE
jgi:uncharacterized sulfatase